MWKTWKLLFLIRVLQILRNWACWLWNSKSWLLKDFLLQRQTGFGWQAVGRLLVARLSCCWHEAYTLHSWVGLQLSGYEHFYIYLGLNTISARLNKASGLWCQKKNGFQNNKIKGPSKPHCIYEKAASAFSSNDRQVKLCPFIMENFICKEKKLLTFRHWTSVITIHALTHTQTTHTRTQTCYCGINSWHSSTWNAVY